MDGNDIKLVGQRTKWIPLRTSICSSPNFLSHVHPPSVFPFLLSTRRALPSLLPDSLLISSVDMQDVYFNSILIVEHFAGVENILEHPFLLLEGDLMSLGDRQQHRKEYQSPSVPPRQGRKEQTAFPLQMSAKLWPYYAGVEKSQFCKCGVSIKYET